MRETEISLCVAIVAVCALLAVERRWQHAVVAEQPRRAAAARRFLGEAYPARSHRVTCAEAHDECVALVDGVAPFRIRCDTDHCWPIFTPAVR